MTILDSISTEPARLGYSTADGSKSAAWWAGFLEKELANTRDIFRMKPKLLLGQVRSERQIANDYAGRELLELVQNAADAATDAGGGGRVRIEITRQGLVVANTGHPFRTGGVESLMTAHASDKPGRKAALIGAKGLGFRALLNWSHEPVVSSGGLEIAFSTEHAAAQIRALAAESEGIAKICADEEELPVPVLAFPAFGADMSQLPDGAQRSLLDKARERRASGYDTVVAAPFYDDRVFARAVLQADEFQPTFLLFVPSLVEIILEVEGRAPVLWSRRPAGKDLYEIEVAAGGTVSTQRWVCKHEKGETPANGGRKAATFEMAIAILMDQPTRTGFLHSYFPTGVRLPFPALFHATLELDSNRKAFHEGSDRNEAVLQALARFFARVVQQLLKARQIANALDLLARDREFPDTLRSFEAQVYEAVRPLDLIPTMRGRRLSAKTVRRGPAGYEAYLPARLFADLAKSRGAADLEVMNRLGVEILRDEAVLRTLRKAELSMEERARAIAGVAKNPITAEHQKWKWLFLDQREKPLAPRNTPFPPPADEDRLPELPGWARSKFIHPKLWRLLMRKMAGQSPRDRIRRLAGFGITEYSNESIIASLRQQAGRALSVKGADAGQVQRELLATVFALYHSDNRTPPGSFKVCCADGVWREAREVHLSAGYGQQGRINAALYASAPELLLGEAADNGIVQGAARDPETFFEWIGVNRWPRAATLQLPANLRPRLLRAIPQDITVRDSNSHQTFQKHEIYWDYNFIVECSMIVGLEKILATAESDAILAWLGHDPRFDHAAPQAFATSAKGRKDGKAGFRPYEGRLPDLVRALISETAWLACRDDTYRAPADTMAQPIRLAELFSIPRPAAVGSDERFGLTQPLWRRGLDNALVPQGLADLPEGRIFELLRNLKDRSPTEEVVRRLYQQILELESFDARRAPVERQVFIQHGTVLCRKGHGRVWVRPAEALYADQAGFPAAAREFLSLVDLPPRRNTGNVEERFGVKALSQQQHRLDVTRIDEEPGVLAGFLRTGFERTRPFIRALRLSDGSTSARLRRFDMLKLRVAHSVEIAVTLGSQKFDGPLDLWTHVLDGEDLIVAIDHRLSQAQILALAHEAVADGIAEIFDLQSSSDFAKLLSAPEDGLRGILLRRMLPNLSDEEMAELLADLDVGDERYDPVQVDAATLARTPTQSPVPPPEPTPVTPPASISAPEPRPENPSGVTATAVDPGIAAALPDPSLRRRIVVRVGGATGPLTGSTPTDPYRAADAEEWTSLFEHSEGRFALPVNHIRGSGGYGCDCLSFATEADRDAFEEDPSLTDLVVRFIETKSGTVELTETETRAAERRGARYFIYRIVFTGGSRDSAELTLVSDPFAHRLALLARYEFRIDAVPDRQRYQLLAQPEPDTEANEAVATEGDPMETSHA